MGALIYYVEVDKLIAECYNLKIEAGSTHEAAIEFSTRLGPITERLRPLYGEDGECWDWSLGTEGYGDIYFNVIESEQE